MYQELTLSIVQFRNMHIILHLRSIYIHWHDFIATHLHRSDLFASELVETVFSCNINDEISICSCTLSIGVNLRAMLNRNLIFRAIVQLQYYVTIDLHIIIGPSNYCESKTDDKQGYSLLHITCYYYH